MQKRNYLSKQCVSVQSKNCSLRKNKKVGFLFLMLAQKEKKRSHNEKTVFTQKMKKITF